MEILYWLMIGSGIVLFAYGVYMDILDKRWTP
jgi:hypothetical protein